MIEDFEEDPVYLDQPATDGWFFLKSVAQIEIDPTIMFKSASISVIQTSQDLTRPITDTFINTLN